MQRIRVLQTRQRRQRDAKALGQGRAWWLEEQTGALVAEQREGARGREGRGEDREVMRGRSYRALWALGRTWAFTLRGRGTLEGRRQRETSD